MSFKSIITLACAALALSACESNKSFYSLISYPAKVLETHNFVSDSYEESYITVAIPVEPWDNRYVPKEPGQIPEGKVHLVVKQGMYQKGERPRISSECFLTEDPDDDPWTSVCYWSVDGRRSYRVSDVYICNKQKPQMLNCSQVVSDRNIKPLYGFDGIPIDEQVDLFGLRIGAH